MLSLTQFLHFAAWLFRTVRNRTIDALPPEQRYVFEQTELYGRSFMELAEEDSPPIPIATLISRKHYAVLALHKYLRDVSEALL